MKNIKIEKVIKADDLVKVILTADGWMPTTFIFSGNHITCFGDIQAFTWQCTWKTAQQILLGNCNAKNTFYLTEKLEHKSQLCEWDDDLFNKEMEEIKEEFLDELDTDEERDAFIENWEDNKYLLNDVDGHRLSDLDEFFENIGTIDYYEYYDRFYKLPDQYQCAIEFLKAIEDYFEQLNKENKQDEKN